MKANFGDGSDGNVTLDGTTNFNAFSTRSGSIYTLTRDVFFMNLTLDTNVSFSVILKPNGFRIFVREKLTLKTGSSIDDNGESGTSPNGGPGLPPSGAVRRAGSGAGGNGRANFPGAGFVGGDAPVEASMHTGYPLGLTGANAGAGGASGGGQAGGPAGQGNNILNEVPQPRSAAWFDTAVLWGPSDIPYRLSQGAGGGGGASTGNGAVGGGGGGGAGGVLISAFEIDNDGTISAKGGQGAPGAITTGTGAGGGGGGAGGYVGVLFNTASGAGLGSIHAGGGGVGIGAGTGSNGSIGDDGVVITLQETT